MNRSNLPYPIVAPSVLSADFGNIRHAIKLLEDAGAQWFHFDVMDGSFVPPITFGAELVKSVREESKAFFDVHLMIHNPERHIESFKDAGTDLLTVHYETCPHLHYVVDRIHKYEMKAGVVINPATPVSVLTEIVNNVELILVMSVNPGWGGQPFISHTYEKLLNLRRLLDEKQSDALVQVDGGVNGDNVEKLVKNGAQVLVAGSSIYKSSDPPQTFRDLSEKVKQKLTV